MGSDASTSGAEDLPIGEARFERLGRMVAEHSAATFFWEPEPGRKAPLLLDVNTANMLVTVTKNLNADNRAKFLGMEWTRMVILGWLLVGRAEEM